MRVCCPAVIVLLCVVLVLPAFAGVHGGVGLAEVGSTISGTIKTASGAAIPSVTVALYLGDAQKATTTTNAEGRYTFSGLTAGTYSVRPLGEALTFDPADRSVAAPPGTTSANFVGGYVIAGTIKTAAGVAIPNVSVGLYVGDVLKATTTTYSTGRYYFVGLDVGNYTVKPVLTGKVFTPAHRAVVVPPGSTAANFVAADQSCTISGTIKTASGVALPSVTVALYLGDTQKATTTTNSEGRYTFSGVAAGTYSVRPLGEVLTFDPADRSVAAPPGTTSANFVGGYLICGTVKTAAGVGIPNVTMRLYVGDAVKATTTTYATGRYYFQSLDVGNYTVKPVLTGTVFSPAHRAVVVPPGSTAANFVAADQTCTISGTIKTASGVAIPSVTVALYLGDAQKATTTTNAEGRYTFSQVAAGAYSVRPLGEVLTFDPAHRSVTAPPGTTAANFVGGYLICGTVKTAAGVAIPNVTMRLYQGDTVKATTTTYATGRYYFQGLDVGNYTVKPVLTGTVFSPAHRAVTVPPGSTAANFVGTGSVYTISGLVKTSAGAGLPGISVRLYVGDALKASTTTNSEGRYTFSHVAAGSYTVKPTTDAMTFDPASRAVAAPPGTTSADFVCTGEGYVIAGTIKTAAGVGIPNVSVGLYQGETLRATTTTYSSGRYYFLHVAAGDYTVRPTHEGHVFDPVHRAVTVPPTVTTVDFVGASN